MVLASVRLNVYTARGLTCNRSMGVLGSNLVGHGQDCGMAFGVDAFIAAGFFDGGKDIFCRDVADQLVACKGTAAESGKRAIKTAATGIGGRENFGFGIFRAAVQVHTEFDAGDAGTGTLEEVGHDFWRSVAGGVGERNSFDANVFEPFESFFYDFRATALVR